MKRISTTFLFLKSAGFVLLFLVVSFCVVLAQPQAPITWGATRLLQQAPDSLYPRQVFSHGDTIVATSRTTQNSAYACVSGDNGDTWSLWHRFNEPGPALGFLSITFTADGIFACGDYNGQRGLYKTTNLGQTWQNPLLTFTRLRTHGVVGDTILCSETLVPEMNLTFTTDGGATYAPLRPTQDFHAAPSTDAELSLGRYHYMITEMNVAGYDPFALYYTSAPLAGGDFPEVYRVNPNIFETYYADMEFDSNGIGMIVSECKYFTHFPGTGAILVNRTIDNGQTWSSPDTLTPNQSADTYPRMSHWNNQWIAVWRDSTVSPPYNHDGYWFAFSANWGKSWYPIRQLEGEDLFSLGGFGVDMRQDFVRLYACHALWNNVSGSYYFQWEGAIEPDTVTPIITYADSIDDIVPFDSALHFSATGSDNDSLWSIVVVLQSPFDSLEIPLTQQNGIFSTTQVLPFDTGGWDYYYRGEDMWDHAVVYPADTVWHVSFERDTVNPVIQTALPLDTILVAGHSVYFSATATDNDTLRNVSVYFWQESQTDTIVAPLVRTSNDLFEGNWTSELTDTGDWFYEYRAFDRWWNIGSYPDSFWIIHILDPLSAPSHPLIPELELSAYPNPFNFTTTFTYSLPHDSDIKLSLFDILGRESSIIFNGHESSGTHSITFTATDLPSGIYFARLRTQSQTQIEKIVLLR